MHEITNVLHAAQAGDARATDDLLKLVYQELRDLAKARMAGEMDGGAGMTLQATALVHEAYLRLLSPAADDGTPASKPQWTGRGHFFGAAALAMRRILIERARHHNSIKHGGGQQRVELSDAAIGAATEQTSPTDLIALDDALRKLEQTHPRKAKIVMLRYFAGLSIEETAAAIDLSVATVKNEWAFAKAWLHREMSGSD